MARARDILIRFLGDEKGVKKASQEVSKSLNLVKQSTDLVSKAFKLLSVGAVVRGLKDMALAAIRDQEEQVKLATVMRNTVNATEAQIAAGEAWISTMQRQTGVADSELRPALADLLTFGMSVEKSQKNLAIAMDIATAKGLPLETVVRAIGKASQGTTGALGRMGVVIKDSDGAMLSFDEVMQNAADTMGGSLAAAAGTAAGQARIAKVAFDELAESWGQRLIGPAGFVSTELLAITDQMGDMSGVAAAAQKTLSNLALNGIDVLANKTPAAVTALQAAFDSMGFLNDPTERMSELLEVLNANLEFSVTDWADLRAALESGRVDIGLTADELAHLIELLLIEQNVSSTMVPSPHRQAEIDLLGQQLNAQLLLNDAQLAAASPAFALANAANAVNKAYEAYAAAAEEAGTNSEEAEEAALRLGEAELRLDAASKTFSDEGGQQGVAALRNILEEAGVAAETIDRITEAIDRLNRTQVNPRDFPTVNPVRPGRDSNRIGGFDSGGVVPGPTGAAQLAVVHGGETILPTHKSGRRGGGSIVNNFYLNPVITSVQQRQQAAEMARQVNLVQRERTVD